MMRTRDQHERRMRAARPDTVELLREIRALDNAEASEAAEELLEAVHGRPLPAALKGLACAAAVLIYTEAGKGTDDGYIEAMTLLVSMYHALLWCGTGPDDQPAGPA